MLPPPTVEGERRVDVLVGLDAGEQQAEQDRQQQAGLEPLAVAVDQRMVRPGHRRARAEQDQGVEKRKAPRVEHVQALRRPLAADRLGRRREQRRVEIGPEPGEEEHHLRGDEQDHPVAQVQLDDRRVIALVRFADGVRPPAGHGDQHAGDARERSRTARRGCRASTSPRRRTGTSAQMAPISGQGSGSTRW